MTSYDMSSNAILAWSTCEVNCFCHSEERKRPGICFCAGAACRQVPGGASNDSQGSATYRDLFPQVLNDLVGLVCWIGPGAVVFSNKDNAEGAALKHSGELSLTVPDGQSERAVVPVERNDA
jgi:hypothetical protein